MGLIYNTTNEQQSVKAFGNWFTFKPKQMKMIDDKLSHFLATEKKEYGLVALKEDFGDPTYLQSPEGQAELAAKENEGVKNYIAHHRSIIYNNQVSLRKDLETANLKIDPATLASDGEIKSMEIVAKYQQQEDDAAQKRVDRVKDLMKSVGPAKK